jgi:Flp pilus assembly CpaE family ATPase
VHTLGELLPLAGELSAAHLDDTLWTHADGFRVLPAPAPETASDVRPADIAGVIEVTGAMADVVVVHLPRALDGLALAGLRSADRICEVLSLDVLSFRAAMRALEAMDPLRLPGRRGFVVNRAARGEVTPGDVARVFAAVPLAVLPVERRVGRAQDRGRLLPARSRIGRAFDRLAERVLEEPSDQQEVS